MSRWPIGVLLVAIAALGVGCGKQPLQAQLGGNRPSFGGGSGGAGGAGGGGGAASGGAGGAGGIPGPAALRSGFNLPQPGEPRFMPDELILDIPANVSTEVLDAIAGRYNMTRLETINVQLTGRTLHRWRIDSGVSVASTIISMSAERQVARAQPNYLYIPAQTEQ